MRKTAVMGRERQVSMQEFVVFIGTNAELIKTMPVLRELRRRGCNITFVASGQNYPLEADLLRMSGIEKVDVQVSARSIPQNPGSLLFWSITTFFNGMRAMLAISRGKERAGMIVIVHGDTISTVMGAALGRLTRFQVAHIESGLRSFNYFKPFPEEIDRTLADKMANINFCPDTEAICNLAKTKGQAITTEYNTLVEAIDVALEQIENIALLDRVSAVSKYFILVVHRQEHIYDRQFLTKLFATIKEITKSIECVFILFEPTRMALQKYSMLDEIIENPHIITLDRQKFVDFVKLLTQAEFLITDGGSNQQESYYLGIPCLILRNTKECREGLGENVVLFNGEMRELEDFVDSYEQYRRERVTPEVKPSRIIVDCLLCQPAR